MKLEIPKSSKSFKIILKKMKHTKRNLEFYKATMIESSLECTCEGEQERLLVC